MKKIIAFLLGLITVFLCLSPVIYADTDINTDTYTDTEFDSSIDTEESPHYQTTQKDAVIYTCNYDEGSKSIEIHGTVRYDALVAYSKYTIEIYKIAPTQTLDTVLGSDESEKMTSMAMAINFDLSFKIKNEIDIFSRYAVILRSPNGEAVLSAEPRGITVKSKYSLSSTDRSGFKGVVSDTSMASIYGDMGFGTVIIPVFYDKLINPLSNGYMYSHGDGYVFFDKEYVDGLAWQIKTYSSSGARVYLQLLLPNSGVNAARDESSEYIMPNVYSESEVLLISTYVRFLTERFQKYSDGLISGFVVGKKIDIYRYNFDTSKEISKYAEKYAHYLTVVANSARLKNPDIDIVVPISSYNSYGENIEKREDGYMPSELLDNICGAIDTYYQTMFDFTVLIESEFVPTEIITENEKTTYALKVSDTELNASNLSLMDKYIEDLNKKYQSVPLGYSYLWNVPAGLSGTSLEIAYVYNFYSLLGKPYLSSFLTSFENASRGAIDDAKNFISLINTVSGANLAKGLAQYLGEKDWTYVIEGLDTDRAVQRRIFSSNAKDISNKNWIGSFSYSDFEYGNISTWTGGAFSKNIRSDYGPDGRRALCQTVLRPMNTSFSNLLCLYEHRENLTHTPGLKFELMLADSNNDGALYEVKLLVGTEGNYVEESFIVKAGELSELWLGVDSYSESNPVNYMKISTRSVTGVADEYTLYLYDISGYSDKYNDSELDQLISDDRKNIRDELEREDNKNSGDTLYWVVFGILITAVLIAGVIFIIFRKDDSGKRKRIRNGLINKNQ